MHLEKFIARRRIVEIQSGDLTSALREMLEVTTESFPDLNKDQILKGLLQRENTMTTYLGFGVALPHVRIKMKRRYVLTIGRSQAGIRYDGLKEDERIHLIILLIAGESAKDYLRVLAAVARLIKDRDFVEGLLSPQSLDDVHRRMYAGFGGILERAAPLQQNRVNRTILRHAEKIARGTQCQAIMVFGDTTSSIGQMIQWSKSAKKTILVTRSLSDSGAADEEFSEVIQVKSYSNQRLAQLRSAVLVALSRGTLQVTDRVCCVGGITGSNQFDTVVVVEIEREFQPLLAGQADLLPSDVKPEVLERVLAIATELSVEGREGKPVGCLFVVGDASRVDRMVKPLVLNPFYGYKDEDKNILNPFMDETVKEFSTLDGAFVIRGDGVVLSAGSLIQAADFDHPLPSGLGSRHAAAAAISVATDCVSVVVSSSTGQLTLFRRGVMLPLTEKKTPAVT